jgi:hypothetical protein
MILIRFILIGLIVYLIVRSFTRYRDENAHGSGGAGKDMKGVTKKVSKEVGEYIDYEEVKK